VLVADAAGDRAMLAGTAAANLASAPVPSSAWYRVVVVPANVVPQKRWLRGLQELPLERDTLYAEPILGVGVVETQRLDAVVAAARGDGGAGVLERLRKVFESRALAADPAGAMAVRDGGDRSAAERWLYRSLIKQNEGFMSRHFERKLSMAVTRRLVDTGATPNMMTVVSVAIGLAGAACFLSAAPAWQLTGALLFLAHSILDGCDGELARLKFLESPTGARLDFWGDNLVHVAVWISMAIGFSLEVDSPWPLLPGALAVAGTAISAVLVSRRSSTAPTDATARLADAVANRDFIYLVLLLACFGKAHWFLILVALGTPIFMLLVRWGARRRQAA